MQNTQQQIPDLEAKKKDLIKEISYFGSQHEKTKKDLEDIEKRATKIKDNKIELETAEILKEEGLIELKSVNSKVVAAKKELNELENKYADKVSVLEERYSDREIKLDDVIDRKEKEIEKVNCRIKDTKNKVKEPIEKIEDILEELKAVKV